MPKMKTKKAVKARFKVTGTGKLMHRRRGKRHLLTNKSAKRKRRLGQATTLGDKTREKTIKRMMCAE